MTSSGNPNWRARLPFLDRLRGLAVVGMFFVHPAAAWLAPAWHSGPYFRQAMRVSGLVAPVFLFLAGVSMVLAAHRGRDPSRSEPLFGPTIRRRLLRRGLSIWALGYGLFFLWWAWDRFDGPNRLLKVDVLHCIGAALVVLPSLFRGRRGHLAALAAFLVIPPLGQAMYYLPVVESLPSHLAAYLTVRAPLAQFPILPNWAYVALGVFVGATWTANRGTQLREALYFLALLAGAALLAGGAVLLHWLYYHRPVYVLGLWGYGPVRRGLTHAVWLKAAWVLALFVAARLSGLVLDGLGRWAAAPLQVFGRRSLFAYGFHLTFVYHGPPRKLLGRLSPTEQVLASLALAGAVYLACLAWAASRRRLRPGLAGIARLRPSRLWPTPNGRR